MKNKTFCHLHNHTDYSKLDGAGKISDYINQCKKIGQKYLAITDHGNVDGVIKFQKKCIEKKVRPIIGCEAYIVPDAKKKEKEKRGHITLFVKNEIGWKNLCKILTYANLIGFYYRPRIDYNILLNNCEGLVVSTACAGSFLTLPDGIDFFYELKDILYDDLYLEIMPHDIDVQYQVNEIVLKLKKHHKVKLIATNDCHYVLKDDWKAQEVLLAIQNKTTWNNPNRWKFGFTGLHLRSEEEMILAFEKQNQFKRKEYLSAMYNTMEIANKCSDFRIKKKEISIPEIDAIKGKRKSYADDLLWDLCVDSLKKNEFIKSFKQSKCDKNKYYNRVKEEYNIISSKKFSKYFLLVYDLINFCRQNDIGIGPGRGSVGGSFIAYLLGITKVNPFDFDLLFFRFISEERIDYPDIDIDFEHTKAETVKQYLKDKYGEMNIAGISNFLTMKGKMAVRDVSRVFEVPMKDVNAFTGEIDDFKNKKDLIEDALKTSEGKYFKRKYPEAAEISCKLEGQIRGYGQHAAGVVVSSEDLSDSDKCVLLQKTDGNININWDMEDAEYMGLIKLDILRLKEITILNETKRLIKENKNKSIKFESINLEDKRVLKEFGNGNNVGVFQFNSYGMIQLCKKLKPKDFMTLVHANALYRPGTLRSGMVDEFIERRRGKNFRSVHSDIDRITKNTYGIIVYQEQAMQIANQIAGLSWKEADKIRKVVAKSKGKTELLKYKEKFIDGCIDNQKINKKEAIELWRQLEEFGGYAFNLSHSVEYTMIGFWCQWLKVYFPTEFICAALTYGAEDKKSELIKEAYRLGLTVMLPKVKKSDAFKWTVKGNELFCPFIEVKGFGDKYAIKAVDMERPKEQEQKIKGFYTGKKRKIEKRKKTKMEKILDEIGAFENTNFMSKEAQQYFSFDLILED